MSWRHFLRRKLDTSEDFIYRPSTIPISAVSLAGTFNGFNTIIRPGKGHSRWSEDLPANQCIPSNDHRDHLFTQCDPITSIS